MLTVQLIFIFIGIPTAFIMMNYTPQYLRKGKLEDEEVGYIILHAVFQFVPLYNIVITLLTIVLNLEPSPKRNCWRFSYFYSWLIMAIGSFLLYFLLIGIIEVVSARNKRSNIDKGYLHDLGKDEDVLKEEERVKGELPSNSAVYVRRAKKKYNNVLAVKDVSFAVNKGEVFALLGVSGAGKTTTFKMITLQVQPDGGSFYLKGINMHSEESNLVKHSVGYCPQDDVLIDHLTVKEHLNFYAAIKGIPSDIRREVVNNMIDAFNFGKDANKRAWKLSGGNKRKLSTAIALLGHPEILLLDEPTKGLDPRNRRAIWDIIRREVAGEVKSAVVLTSHLMEEVEALATKVAIMVSGNFHCFGSNQHLKNKYGNSYDMELTMLRPLPADIQNILRSFGIPENSMIDTLAKAQSLLYRIEMQEESKKLVSVNPRARHIFESFECNIEIPVVTIIEFGLVEKLIISVLNRIKDILTSYSIIEETAMKLKLKIPRVIDKRRITFGKIFKYAEELKASGYIADYAIYETRLEHIFQSFANQF